MMKSGFPCVSIFWIVCSVFASTTLALFSRPLLVKMWPSDAITAPCTPGVSAISPTTASLFRSKTTTFVPWLIRRRLPAPSRFR